MFSVVLATHNEEKNLERCLRAVQQIADEIIIADGESTDLTRDIAGQFGARIISTTNKSNFHINKQIAMDAAQGELVLQLDADEVVDAELSQFISKLKADLSAGQLPAEPAAWYIRRKNFFLGTFFKKGGQYPDSVIRLYQNGKARLPQKNVHEQMTVDGKTATAPGHLEHYAFPTFADYMHKFNRYTSFEAERLNQEGIKISTKMMWQYWLTKPLYTFFMMFFRHKGFVDRFPGFVFALMSALHHPFVYLKLEEQQGKFSK